MHGGLKLFFPAQQSVIRANHHLPDDILISKVFFKRQLLLVIEFMEKMLK
jgi:hypothetical protein